MKGFPIRLLVAPLLVGCGACAQYSDVGVTTSSSLVNGCQKVADVSVADSTPPADVTRALSDAARAKGANFVLVASDGARTGEAYACTGPKVASK
jgi:hypothetical protein